MTTRIMAVLAEPATTRACLEGALAAASAVGDATIDALHIMVDPRHIISSSEEVAIQGLRERREGTARQRASAVRTAYRRWSLRRGHLSIPVRWKEFVGGEEAVLSREAREFDLLVLARPKNMDGRDALHAAAYLVRHPFVVVPSTWRADPEVGFSDRVIIAWNGTASCLHAARDATPWLRMAKEVVVIVIGQSELDAQAVIQLLRDEGIVSRLQVVARTPEIALGDQIAKEARELGASLLVMGAYRHSQFLEWVLGGTTRHAMARSEIPMLLEHCSSSRIDGSYANNIFFQRAAP